MSDITIVSKKNRKTGCWQVNEVHFSANTNFGITLAVGIKRILHWTATALNLQPQHTRYKLALLQSKHIPTAGRSTLSLTIN